MQTALQDELSPDPIRLLHNGPRQELSKNTYDHYGTSVACRGPGAQWRRDEPAVLRVCQEVDSIFRGTGPGQAHANHCAWRDRCEPVVNRGAAWVEPWRLNPLLAQDHGMLGGFEMTKQDRVRTLAPLAANALVVTFLPLSGWSAHDNGDAQTQPGWQRCARHLGSTGI